MDRGAWQVTVHGVAKSQRWVNQPRMQALSEAVTLNIWQDTSNTASHTDKDIVQRGNTEHLKIKNKFK